MQFNTSQAYSTQVRSVDGVTFDAGLRAHMLRVYNLMTLGLIVSAIVALGVAHFSAIQALFYAVSLEGRAVLTPIGWLAVLAPLPLAWFGFRLNYSLPVLTFNFFAFSTLLGISLASLVLGYTGASIARVFFITAGTFGAMSLYGYTTKRDLTSVGSFLTMGLFGIIIASIANIFIGSSALYMAISVIGVVIFVGLTAYDTQKIKQNYAERWGTEANAKLAVQGALELYLDFVNLFIMLMRLIGDRR